MNEDNIQNGFVALPLPVYKRMLANDDILQKYYTVMSDITIITFKDTGAVEIHINCKAFKKWLRSEYLGYINEKIFI